MAFTTKLSNYHMRTTGRNPFSCYQNLIDEIFDDSFSADRSFNESIEQNTPFKNQRGFYLVKNDDRVYIKDDLNRDDDIYR